MLLIEPNMVLPLQLWQFVCPIVHAHACWLARALSALSVWSTPNIWLCSHGNQPRVRVLKSTSLCLVKEPFA